MARGGDCTPGRWWSRGVGKHCGSSPCASQFWKEIQDGVRVDFPASLWLRPTWGFAKTTGLFDTPFWPGCVEVASKGGIVCRDDREAAVLQVDDDLTAGAVLHILHNTQVICGYSNYLLVETNNFSKQDHDVFGTMSTEMQYFHPWARGRGGGTKRSLQSDSPGKPPLTQGYPWLLRLK